MNFQVWQWFGISRIIQTKQLHGRPGGRVPWLQCWLQRRDAGLLAGSPGLQWAADQHIGGRCWPSDLPILWSLGQEPAWRWEGPVRQVATQRHWQPGVGADHVWGASAVHVQDIGLPGGDVPLFQWKVCQQWICLWWTKWLRWQLGWGKSIINFLKYLESL